MQRTHDGWFFAKFQKTRRHWIRESQIVELKRYVTPIIITGETVIKNLASSRAKRLSISIVAAARTRAQFLRFPSAHINPSVPLPRAFNTAKRTPWA